MQLQRLYKLFILSLLLCGQEYDIYAQSQDSPDAATFLVVETSPEYAGGLKAFVSFIQERLTVKPTAEQRNQKVYVEFIVDKSGQVRDGKILKGVSKEIDEEILRVVLQSPNWVPGRQGEKVVHVKRAVAIPIK